MGVILIFFLCSSPDSVSKKWPIPGNSKLFQGQRVNVLGFMGPRGKTEDAYSAWAKTLLFPVMLDWGCPEWWASYQSSCRSQGKKAMARGMRPGGEVIPGLTFHPSMLTAMSPTFSWHRRWPWAVARLSCWLGGRCWGWSVGHRLHARLGVPMSVELAGLRGPSGCIEAGAFGSRAVACQSLASILLDLVFYHLHFPWKGLLSLSLKRISKCFWIF